MLLSPVTVVAYPRDTVRAVMECYPGTAGGSSGWEKIYLRYRGALRLVERWAVCDAEQNVRVFPASEQSGDKADFYLMRARQIELQKRRLCSARNWAGVQRVCGIISRAMK